MAKQGYQFVSEMPYAAKRISARPRLKTGRMDRWSTLDIVGEALRWQDGAHLMHFANRGMAPHPPIFVDGMTSDDEVRAWHDELVRVALAPGAERPLMMTARGVERQRENSPVMLTVVAGYPQPELKSEPEILEMALEDRQRYMHELIERRKAETLESEHFKAWRDRTLAWAKKRYKSLTLRLAVVHYDESHIHMHLIFDDHGRTVKPHSLHAAAQSLGPAASRQEQKAAYAAAGVALQDSYHQEVAGPLGIGRISPTPRGRATAAERKAAKAQRAADAALERTRREYEEETCRMRAAHAMQAEADRRNAAARAAREAAAAHEKMQADIAALRERQLAQLAEEMEAMRAAQRARAVAEIREQAGEALARVHAREATWAKLLEEAVPDPQERARMMAAVGLVKAPARGAGAASR